MINNNRVETSRDLVSTLLLYIYKYVHMVKKTVLLLVPRVDSDKQQQSRDKVMSFLSTFINTS